MLNQYLEQCHVGIQRIHTRPNNSLQVFVKQKLLLKRLTAHRLEPQSILPLSLPFTAKIVLKCNSANSIRFVAFIVAIQPTLLIYIK